MMTSEAAVEEYVLAARTRPGLLSRLCCFPVLLACTLALLVFFVFPRTIADPDLGWHLKNAAYLLQHHDVVRRDVFSFTTGDDPWIDHEWLAELPFYAAWKFAGVRGIWLVAITLVETSLLGIFALAYQQSRNAKAAFLVCLPAILLSSVSFGPRTLLFGWICLVPELIILARFQNGCDATWLLPPLFALWVNLHGSWLIGMILLIVFLLCGLLEGQWGQIEARAWNSLQRRKLAAASVLSMVALFVNPYGWRLVAYPFDMAFHQKLNISSVVEWQPLDFHSPRGKVVVGMMAAAILLQLVGSRTWMFYELCFALIGLYSGLTYSRFLFLAAILICPEFSEHIATFLPHHDTPEKPWLGAGILTCAIAAMALQIPGAEQLNNAECGAYPCQTMSYLKQLHPDGNTLNDYLWGGYLIWKAPQIRVFIDSRVDIFEHHGVFEDYLHAVRLDGTLSILDKYKIRYVVFKNDSPLTRFLEHTPQWKLDYKDNTSVVLERVGVVSR
ncbi:MAG TPA: hypothetical protein VFN53_14000 [Acidobacteriaceae bacterium]|nr:hypothetical protein [Acidobacteriaceae bacterium]